MKNHNIRQTLLALSVAACLIPSYARSQSTGTGAFPDPRGTNSTTVPNQSDTAPTKDLRPHKGVPDSATQRNSPTRTHETQPLSGVDTTENSMDRDQALTETDASLNNRIRTAFKADLSMRETIQEVSLQSDNGIVTLTGTVATEKEKAEVEFKVRHITGVKEVKNNLLMAPHAGISSSNKKTTVR